MALRRPSDSSGDLRQDLKQIAIDRIGQSEYDAMDAISKQKISEFTNEQAIAIQAFLQRQEINITDLEAEGLILPGQINTAGSPAAQTNVNPVKVLVQVSETSNKVGLPSVIQNVKKSAAKFLKISK